MIISIASGKGINVITAAPELAPEAPATNYIDNTLMTGTNVCDH